VVKIPPVGERFSVLNFGRFVSFSVQIGGSLGSEKLVVEKFAEMGFGGAGQRVISVI